MTRTSPARIFGLASAAVLLVLGTGFFFAPDTAEAQRSASSTRRGSSSSSSSPRSSSPSRSTSSRSGSSASRSSGSSAQRSAVPRGSASSRGGASHRGRDVRRPRPGDDRRYTPGYGGYYGGHGWYYGPSYRGYYHRGYGGWPYFFGYYGPSWGFGWHDGPYVSAYRGGYYGHRTPQAGALDLDISPEKAEIWIDGEYVGVADQFDGWPDYLWLPRGSYDLVAYRDGYRTLERRISVRAGSVVELDDDLPQGPSVTPDEIFARSAAVRSERDDRRGGGDWRDRVPDDRRIRVRVEQRHDDDRDDADDTNEWRSRRGDGDEVVIEVERRSDDTAGRDWQGRSGTARLDLQVEPADAAVYLDGRFVGTAGEIGGELEVDAGEHELEIVRPGLEPRRVEFEADAGERVDLTIELED